MSETNTHEELSFGALLEQSFNKEETREGDIVKGTIVALRKDQAIIDFGFKSEGVVSLNEFPKADGKPTVSVGDIIDVYVESKRENVDGLCVLSKEKADRMKIWDDIQKAYDDEATVDGVITARVKGGLQVDIGVKAFLPGSQVDLRPIRNLDKLIGETHRFKVIKFNKRRNNIVLSRRLGAGRRARGAEARDARQAPCKRARSSTAR